MSFAIAENVKNMLFSFYFLLTLQFANSISQVCNIKRNVQPHNGRFATQLIFYVILYSVFDVFAVLNDTTLNVTLYLQNYHSLARVLAYIGNVYFVLNFFFTKAHIRSILHTIIHIERWIIPWLMNLKIKL